VQCFGVCFLGLGGWCGDCRCCDCRAFKHTSTINLCMPRRACPTSTTPHQRRQTIRQAQVALLDAAKRTLPQQRRSQLAAEHKRAGVAAHREHRRQRRGGGGAGAGTSTSTNISTARRKPLTAAAAPAAAAVAAGSASSSGSDDASDDDNGDEIEFQDVPDEVTRVILASLDPVSLGRAACVCRGWREMVAADGRLWGELVVRVFQWRGEDRVRQEAAAAGLEELGAAALAAVFRSLALGERRVLGVCCVLRVWPAGAPLCSQSGPGWPGGRE